MISVEDREQIRWVYFIEQKSLRQIASELHVSRETIGKTLGSAEADVYTLTRPRPAPILIRSKAGPLAFAGQFARGAETSANP